ncbi:MAG: hypothetical protein IJD17_01140 [Clostridia bacterium]|nr:hypothetical protein [Clostridia bacterium]
MDQNNFQPEQPYVQQPQMPPQKKSNPLGVVSLILGIVTIVFCWMGCTCTSCQIASLTSNGAGGAAFGWIMVVLAVVGIVLAVLSMKTAKGGVAVAGLVLCIIGAVFCIIGAACASCACGAVNSTVGAASDALNELAGLSGYGF